MLLLATVALGVPLALNLRARVTAEVRSSAQAQADLVAATAADLLSTADRAELLTLIRTAAGSVRGRILVVDSHGRVLADSAGPRQLGASYASRPEIKTALTGRQVQTQRNSRTLQQDILATAVPIIRNGRPAGAVRLTQSMSAVAGAVRRSEFGLVLIGLIVLALGLLAGAFIAAQVARPIKRLEEVARAVAHGDLRARAEVEGSREQRSLSVSFNEMTDRIARLLDAQRQFVADASHQLRTPLTGLRLRLEEAKALEPNPDSHVELDAAMAELDRLAQTVEELLVLSRAGERRLSGTAVELGAAADSAVRRWQQRARDSGIALTYLDEDVGDPVWTARSDVERVLDILIENALAYSPAHATVEVASGAGVIEVRDQGAGLAPDEAEAVFERFRRGRAGLAGPHGSGLGLAIARELARGWDGELTLTNRPGGGAVARLRLPSMASIDTLPAVNRPPATLADR